MNNNKRLGMVIDQERCIGCEACIVACRLENNSSGFWIRVETQGGREKDTPSGVFPNLAMNFLPRLCNHCVNPPCVEACPEEALQKRDDGVVILDQGLCTGCQTCLSECPYSIIIFNEESNLAEKCNLCYHRIDEGLEPFCVVCCEGQAIFYGDLNDPNSIVSQLISKRKVFQLNPEKGTDPSVYYCSPKPKRRL
jgi:Fe-S-cluster-containing dehydrogenase component